MEGSVVRSGNQVRTTAKLIDAPSERRLWAESYQRELKDVLALEGEVVRDIAQEIRVKISPREETRLTARRPVDPEAHEAYLKGRHYWYKFNAESEKSGHFFEDAIASFRRGPEAFYQNQLEKCLLNGEAFAELFTSDYRKCKCRSERAFAQKQNGIKMKANSVLNALEYKLIKLPAADLQFWHFR